MSGFSLRLSRRGFLRGVGSGGAAVAGGGLLAACGTAGTKKNEADQAASADHSDADQVVNFSNWPLYIDVDDKDESKRPTLAEFTRQTGIKVTYTEDINDNNEFFGKIRPQLSAGQDSGRDLMVMTDWMAARLVRLNWAQKFTPGNVANVEKNLAAALRTPDWDKSRAYSAPWQSGLSGIANNAKVTGEVRTFAELLTRSDLKGKVSLLSEMRDTMGLALLQMGKDPANFSDDDFAAAIDTVQKAVDSGQIRKFTGNEYAQDLVKGNIAACVAWSGDVIQLQFDDPNIKFVTPEAGLMLWSDNMLIPNKAQHKKNAEALINYYYDPAVAAKLAAYVNYICPVAGAKEELAKSDPDLANNQLIFPDEVTLAKTHIFKGLTEDQEKSYEGEYQKLIGA